MIKRIFALLLALVLMLALAACGETPDPTEPPTAPATNPPTTPPTTPATNPPTEAPTDPVASVNMEQVYNDCLALMGEMIPLDADLMLDFCGIKAEDCVSAFVAISADGLLTDEIWIIEAVDEEAAQRLLDKADKRLKAKAEESETYSPEQYAVVQKAQVIRVGNCIAVLVAPNVDQLKAVVDTAFGN